MAEGKEKKRKKILHWLGAWLELALSLLSFTRCRRRGLLAILRQVCLGDRL